MPSISRATKIVAALGSTALVLTLGSVPFLVSGADHLDAPSLGHISVDAQDNISLGKVNGPLDINDVYVFKATSGRTALAMTVNPAINVLGPETFASNGAYALNIDLTGDAVADLRYVTTFGEPDARGVQHYVVKANGRAVASGFTDNAKGKPITRAGVKAFAGQRSDPFFFDLLGFLGTVKGEGTRRLNDAKTGDFFPGLNTLAIVLELPNSALGGNGTTIGVWGTTRWQDAQGAWHQADQMGRPAINTVFNAAAADKEAFNRTPPSQQRTTAPFRNNIIGVLEFFSSLDSEGAYTANQAAALADVLLPDVLTYEVGTTAAGPLNGRGLTDDVIDVELNIVTGGYPFAGRNAMGAITGDGVGPHADYLASFPYLGSPHP